MTNIDTIPVPTVTATALALLYDPVLQQFIFSSADAISFFGEKIKMDDPFPFASLVHEESIDACTTAWQRCLRVKDRQKETVELLLWRNNKKHFFQVQADGVTLGGHAYVLLTISRNNAAALLDDYAEFTDIAVHDLDAPLRRLTVMIEKAMAASSNGAGTDDYARRIQGALATMRSLVDQLSVLAAVNEKPVVEACNLAGIIQKVIAVLQPSIQAAGATISYGDLPVVQGDKEQYRLLFENTLGNALLFAKATTPPVITISCEPVDAAAYAGEGIDLSRKYYRLVIADNGLGINPEAAGKIFRPFTRLHTRSAYPGNGIGLAIVKRIIINHGGLIYVQSAEHAGARFIFILPQTINDNAQLP